METLSPQEIKEAQKGHIPYPFKKNRSSQSKKERIEKIAYHFKEIMEALDLDLNDPSLEKTPNRVAKMYVEEVFSGLFDEMFPKISVIESPLQFEQMIRTTVTFTSFCEHHFVPMEGTARIAYLPKDRLIGLSKIPRIVKYFANRPQLQERLTEQIAHALSTLIQTEDVAVAIDAKHFCVVARGIESQESVTYTTCLNGKFERDEKWQHQFFTA